MKGLGGMLDIPQMWKYDAVCGHPETINALKSHIKKEGSGSLQNCLLFMPNDLLTVSKTVERTRKERLWSWPWKPLRKTKVIQIPDPKLYMINTNLMKLGTGRGIIDFKNMYA